MQNQTHIKPNLDEILEQIQNSEFKEVIQQANDEALKRMKQANPILIGIGKAKDHVPEMRENLILHAGPPITWKQASGALKGAIIAGLLFEGLAKTKEEAIAIMEKGDVDLGSCHDHNAVGPMAGIITASMSVYIIEDQMSGYRTYSNISDDPGDYRGSSIRFGVYEKRAIDHIHWLERDVVPILNQAILDAGGIDFVPIIGKSLLMRDDCHVTMNAATPLFLRKLMPGIIKACRNKELMTKIITLIYQDDLFALNPIMATCKAIGDAGRNVNHSSIVTTMARNGTEFGIKVSGLGNQWFTGLSEIGRPVLLMPGVSPSDINRDMGDSAITETMGLGGTVKSISGSSQDAINITLKMYDITHAESDSFRIPELDGRGAPMGFDILKIVDKKSAPQSTLV
ncbi:YlbE family protein [Legionella tunisiensis]|uniref:DUF1116 domain-containing protein n=1 Tax=Legionella tunisiensis TaxID=1034944 RepID=UPI00030313DE|nr:DUF1116 domain-containing protein [Legionella tunisiensis]